MAQIIKESSRSMRLLWSLQDTEAEEDSESEEEESEAEEEATPSIALQDGSQSIPVEVESSSESHVIPETSAVESPDEQLEFFKRRASIDRPKGRKSTSLDVRGRRQSMSKAAAALAAERDPLLSAEAAGKLVKVRGSTTRLHFSASNSLISE